MKGKPPAGAFPPRRAPAFRPCPRLTLRARRAGEDHLAFHADDDEARYGEEPYIASVSFGVARDFVLRRVADINDKVCFSLGGGAVLLMHGKCQKTWQHGVPTRSRATLGGRINLTFRHVRT